MPCEFIYEEIAHVAGITEYGVAFDDLVSGVAPSPREGARFDAAIEGTLSGARLNGVVRGVDYLHVRADGEITTDDEKKMALEADDVLALEPGSTSAELRNDVSQTTVAAEYSWLNRIQIWAPGTVDLAELEIRFKACAV